MSKTRKVEEICAGRTVRIFGARPDGSTVSFVESYRNCGNKACRPCADRNRRPHGPYWTLNYTDEHGRPRSLYIGRRLPELANRHAKVCFADVLGFYRESEKHRELLRTRQEEILRMKKVIETLYEDIRLLRKQGRHAGSHRPSVDRLFKQLVMKYHPDRNAHCRFEAEEVMKDINQLYQKLVKA